MRENIFDNFVNPVVSFAFFALAIIFSMFFAHPLLLLVSLICALSLNLLLSGRNALKSLVRLLPLFLLVIIINPLFNTGGETVLFTYFGRAFTLEALLYAGVSATMLLTVLLWFSSYNIVMTSDKFIYLFGKMIPSISLVLSMVLRLVPSYERKLAAIGNARKCVGKGVTDAENARGKIESGALMVSVLTSWAFEGALMTADSMRSRGYGTSPRTSFARYSFRGSDALILFALLGIAAALLVLSSKGVFALEIIPRIIYSGSPQALGLGAALCFALMFAPTGFIIGEEIKWHILKSRI